MLSLTSAIYGLAGFGLALALAWAKGDSSVYRRENIQIVAVSLFLALGSYALRSASLIFDQNIAPTLGLYAAFWLVYSVAMGVRRGRFSPRLWILVSAATFAALALVVGLRGEADDITDLGARWLLVFPVVSALIGLFGGSFGWLWGEAGHDQAFERRISYRLFQGRRGKGASTVTGIAVVGVTLGVWLVVVALAILSGFGQDLKSKTLDSNGHVFISGENYQPITPSKELRAALNKNPEVMALSDIIKADVTLRSSSNFAVAEMIGRTEGFEDTLPAMANIQGTFEKLNLEDRVKAEPTTVGGFAAPKPMPGVVLGYELALMLNAVEGSLVQLISPTLEVLTPAGVFPKTMTFRVDGTLRTGMIDYDSRYAVVDQKILRRFLEMGPASVSELRVRLKNPDFSDATVGPLRSKFSPEFSIADWKSRNQTLFAALALERVVVFMVLAFVIVVASFSIVNTLTLSILERKREIAILKTLGATDASVVSIFVFQGFGVGMFGVLSGMGLALLTLWGLKSFGFGIPTDIYYLDALPIDLQISDLLAVLLLSLLIVWTFATLPALRASRLLVVEGLRDG